jgi:hypothetical protein
MFYYYYGDPSAMSESDPVNVFDFNEPWNNLDQWTVTGDAPTVSGNVVTIFACHVVSKQTYGFGYGVESGWKTSSIDATNNFVGFNDWNFHANGIGMAASIPTNFYAESCNELAHDVFKNTGLAKDTIYHTTDVQLVSSSLVKYYIDDALVNSTTDSNYIYASELPVLLNSNDYTASVACEWLLIHKVQPTMPTLTVNSGEDNPNNITVSFTLNAGSTSVKEADTSIILTVTKNITCNSIKNVTINTTDGTAIGNQDFNVLNQTLTFQPDELTKAVVLSIKERNDITSYPKTFTVALSNPTGNATLGTPSSITITIREGNLVQRNTQIKGIESTMNMLWLIPLVLVAMFVISMLMGEGVDVDSVVNIAGVLVGIIAIIVVAYVVVGSLVLS